MSLPLTTTTDPTTFTPDAAPCSITTCNDPPYLLSDHLGSTAITTDVEGNLVSETRYNPWGEVRRVSGLSPTDYTYTDQYSYMDDPTTAASEGFGLMFYNARWYDPGLGRFTQADTIVPLQSQGVQAWDRYAFVNNNPVKYTDPSGHCAVGGRHVPDSSPACKSEANPTGNKPLSDKKYREKNNEDLSLINRHVSPRDSFIDKTYTEEEIQGMIDLLQQYYDDAIGGAILAGVVSGVGALLGQFYVPAAGILVGAELLWEAHNASTLITYLTAAKDIAHEQGEVRITMSHRDNIFGGIPVVIEHIGASSAFVVTSPGLQFAFDVDH